MADDSRFDVESRMAIGMDGDLMKGVTLAG